MRFPLNPDATNTHHRPLAVESGTPLLDVFRVESVREIMGDGFAEIVGAFISSLPTTLAELRHTLAQGELETLGNTAHGLKGSAGNMGAIALTELAKRLEMAGKSKNAAEAQALMTQMEGEMQRAADAFQTLVGN